MTKTSNLQLLTPKELGVGRWLRRAAAMTALVSVMIVTSHAQDVRMDQLAEQYVRLVLAVGQHDADYVDAYYGPPEWRTQAETEKLSLQEISSPSRAWWSIVLTCESTCSRTAASPLVATAGSPYWDKT